MIKLICPECQHENEAERIYCHSCGARLERSAVASRLSPKEGLKETQQRVRNLFDPSRAKLRLLFFRFSKLILGAFALAALLQMILAPDIPPPQSDKGLLLSQINLELENAITNHRPPQLQYTEDQINSHLGSALKNKQSVLNKPFLDFRRAVIAFGEGVCAVTVERSVFGFSIYTGSMYAVRSGGGKLTVLNQGGSIGRLPIHPKIMQFLDVVMADVWSALDRERKLVAKMSAIEFHKTSVVLTSPPE